MSVGGESKDDLSTRFIPEDISANVEAAIQTMPELVVIDVADPSVNLQPSVLDYLNYKVRWPILITYLIVHVGAVAAFWFFSWPAIGVAVVLYVLTGMLGVTVGYHRLMAHDSFETYGWVKAVHLFFAALALQLGPITWTRIHKVHHIKADTDEDPHAQHRGFFWGYVGWAIFSAPVLGRSEVFRKIKLRSMYRDPVILFFEKYYLHVFIVSLIVLYLAGGISMLLWAGFFRVALTTHFIWALNRFAHHIGERPFKTPDQSTNNAVLAAITFGEGWHNNHHAFPVSARFGLHAGQIDLGFIWISVLEKVGLVWNVKTPASMAPPPIGPSK